MTKEQLAEFIAWLQTEADKNYELFMQAEDASRKEDEYFGKHLGLDEALDKLKEILSTL